MSIISYVISALLACNSNNSNTVNAQENTAYQAEVLSHADYNIIFDNDSIEGMPIAVIDIGTLNVPSGEIVICDPLVTVDIVPLDRKVEAGEYRVKLFAVKSDHWGSRNAIAKLEFTQKRAEKWVLAHHEGAESTDLNEGEIFGFPVDSGLGGFFDMAAGREYLEFQKKFRSDHPGGNIYSDVFEAEFRKNVVDKNDPNAYGTWLIYKLPDSNLNITMFESGFGDGFYPAYWGIDKDGKVTSLVIDFLIVLAPDE